MWRPGHSRPSAARGRGLRDRVAAVLALTLALVAATVLVDAVAGGGRPAWAGGRNEPFHGDLDGDGRTDQARLVSVSPGECAVRVRWGRRGGFQPPQTYRYPEPGGSALGACPDLGVILDLGGDGTTELVATWFAGPPPGVDDELLVLRDFAPVAGLRGMFQPSYIGTADFTGDRRPDVYEWTDQGEGFRTLVNTADGRLVPGPVRWCTTGRPQPALADFDGDGRMDVAIAYPEGCDDFSAGVVVVLDDGTPIHLERDDVGEQRWSVSVRDGNRDGWPDVRTLNLVTGEVRQFRNTGDGGFVIDPCPVQAPAWSRKPRPVPRPR